LSLLLSIHLQQEPGILIITTPPHSLPNLLFRFPFPIPLGFCGNSMLPFQPAPQHPHLNLRQISSQRKPANQQTMGKTHLHPFVRLTNSSPSPPPWIQRFGFHIDGAKGPMLGIRLHAEWHRNHIKRSMVESQSIGLLLLHVYL
jgi:hypothetical protein